MSQESKESPKAWEVVREMETKAEAAMRELDEARATMLINCGPEGRMFKNLVSESDNMSKMIFKLYCHLTESSFRPF